jgi:hypothetical protein
MSETAYRKERCEEEGHAPTAAPHTCPYQYDVNDDPEFRCVCCAECETECADDI